MKKFFLSMFLMIPLYAGRFYDPEQALHEYNCQLIRIRTHLGFDLPRDEAPEEISIQERRKLLEQFMEIWVDYNLHKNFFRISFDSTEKKRQFFEDFDIEILSDKKKYLTPENLALLGNNEE